jgi:hypothetical protein
MPASRQKRPLVVVSSFDLDAISLAERPHRVSPPLGVGSRCVVTFTSFSEFNKAEGGDIWLAIDERRPLACIAGIWTNWTSVRKVKKARLPTTSSRSTRSSRTRRLALSILGQCR